MADNKPKFSAGMVAGIITLFWVAVFGYAVIHGANGFTQHQVVEQAK
ncbi:MAG TPA: hypothetical protein VIP51_16505 [Eoetvoesiella sp.]